MCHGDGPPTEKAIYDLSMSYINQLERDGDIKIDVKTRRVVKNLDDRKYQEMAEIFEEWITAVEQTSRVGNMTT